jgi:hypothetical protein
VARWSCFWRCFFSMLVQLFIGSVLGFCVFFSNVSSVCWFQKVHLGKVVRSLHMLAVVYYCDLFLLFWFLAGKFSRSASLTGAASSRSGIENADEGICFLMLKFFAWVLFDCAEQRFSAALCKSHVHRPADSWYL